MRFLDYLRDRLGWLVICLMCGGISVLVMYLDGAPMRTTAGTEDGAGTVFYVFLLLAVLLAFFMAWDFTRQTPFYRTLRRLTSAEDEFEEASTPGAVTKEQSAFVSAIASGFRRYQGQLERYRHKEERHRRFSDRWAHFMKTPVSVISLLVKEGAEADTPERPARSLKASKRRTTASCTDWRCS